ncbi:1-pyrroline-5-carboxylate dehydrogenase [Chytridiales sp. JEL 0842]|nr:1-pyrroline-5-carboxylate dehydrogenase [Chytridiales sp. JEL 0842]
MSSASFGYKYGKPIMSFLLYSSLTMISLEYVWTRLDYEESRIKYSERIDQLKDKLNSLQQQSKAIEGPANIPPYPPWGGPAQPVLPPPVSWTAHQTPEGRTYWYNAITKQTTWDKPEELKTPLERALLSCPWKEYTTDQGKKYYSNSATKQTVWEMPAEYRAILDKYQEVSNNQVALNVVPSVTKTDIEPTPSFETKEEAEKAFKELLTESGVEKDWTWEQTMRMIISKPMYRALKTLQERKQAFQDYIDEKQKREKEAVKSKTENFQNMLNEVFHMNNFSGSTRYKRAVAVMSSREEFLAVDESMRVKLFEEYTEELRRKDKEEKRFLRKENMEKFKSLLENIPDITVDTTWRIAQSIFRAHPAYVLDTNLQTMDMFDVLSVFEDHLKILEAQYYEHKSWERAQQRRQERKNRDGFRALLEKLRNDGIIHIGVKWKDVVPHFVDNPYYEAMLGQPGSTPIEMFWDVVVDVHNQYQMDRKVILDAVRHSGIIVTTETPFEDFLSEIRSILDNSHIDNKMLRAVFDEYMSKALAKQKEERRRHDRKLRKKMDAFKSLLKRAEPPILISTTFEEMQQRLNGRTDYEALEPAHRVEVFERYIRRLKEKEEESGSENEDIEEDGDGHSREKRRKDKERNRDKDRDKERRRHRDNDVEGRSKSKRKYSYAPGSAERRELVKALGDMKAKVAEQGPFVVPAIVNGQKITSSPTRKQPIPFDHKQAICEYHEVDEAGITKAIDTALAAKPAWESMPFNDRAAIFLKAADLLSTKYRYQVMAATMLGQGKNAWQAEIDAAAELCDFWRFNAKFAADIYSWQPEKHAAGTWNRLEYRPLEGFTVAYSPFNFTAIGGNLAGAPALMGNVVLWKPSPMSVYSNYLVYEILKESGLPDGVIQFVPGDAQLMSKVAFSHPEFAGLHFTGSTSVFKSLWRQISNNLDVYKSYPRIVGETGGKNMHFIHKSANAQQAALQTVRSAFEYMGQKCSACSRVYVPDNLADEYLRTLVAETEKLQIGAVDDFSNFMSAVISQGSLDKIKGYLDNISSGKDKTSRILAGGKIDDSKGYFVQPTVVLTTDPKAPTMVDELFGPVVTVYVYPAEKYEETLDLADKTSSYALTCGLFAGDREAIIIGSNKLRNAAGNFYINDKSTGAVVGQQPFGGSRGSGTNDKAGSNLYDFKK